MSALSILKKRNMLRKWIKDNYKRGNTIKRPKVISDISKIELGKNVYIGPEAYIMSKGGVKIGSNVIIAANLFCWTENHNYKNASLLPYDLNDIEEPIVIEDNVWIGVNVQICPGSHIGEGSVVGMGAVVRGKVPPMAVVMGNPAQVMGYRNKEHYEQLKMSEAFFYPEMRFSKRVKR